MEILYKDKKTFFIKTTFYIHLLFKIYKVDAISSYQKHFIKSANLLNYVCEARIYHFTFSSSNVFIEDVRYKSFGGTRGIKISHFPIMSFKRI